MDTLERILVPLDFSACSEAALTYAVTLATKCDANLHLLHVLSQGDSDRSSRSRSEAIHRTSQLITRLSEIREVLAEGIVRNVLSGIPTDEIVRYATEKHIDLIVMGTHGRTGLAHLVLGSVAEKVLKSAPCPVVTVRANEKSTDASASLKEETEDAATGAELAVERMPAIDLLQRALKLRASDVHLDPTFDGKTVVRVRIDGLLENYCKLEGDLGRHLGHQLMILGQLDIADPLRPQEGRLKLPTSLPDLQARITTCPVDGGVSVSVRQLPRGNIFRPLSELGLSSAALAATEDILHQQEGLVLVTGPTGSGKTTTVYSMLQVLNVQNRNLVSIEDPVEYSVPFIRQMAIDDRHGVTMSNGLRTLLRMDPDVVFIGEIRDAEAADIGMRASSSGKFVFSTLHTRDVASTVTAVRDLHVDNRSLAGNLRGIISQRLVRRVCGECLERCHPTDEENQIFSTHQLKAPREISRAKGCPRCRGSGYYGRVGVFEVVMASEKLVHAIERGESETGIRKLIRSVGTPSLMADALTKVCDGITTLDEAQGMSWILRQ